MPTPRLVVGDALGEYDEVLARGGALLGSDDEELPAGERYRIDAVPRALRLIVPRDHVEPAL